MKIEDVALVLYGQFTQAELKNPALTDAHHRAELAERAFKYAEAFMTAMDAFTPNR